MFHKCCKSLHLLLILCQILLAYCRRNDKLEICANALQTGTPSSIPWMNSYNPVIGNLPHGIKCGKVFHQLCTLFQIDGLDTLLLPPSFLKEHVYLCIWQSLLLSGCIGTRKHLSYMSDLL